MNSTPQIIAALLALGMALSFSLADRDSSTSRMLSLFFAAVGVSIIVSSQIEIPLRESGQYPAWGGIFALPEVLAFLFAFEWILRVRRTIPTRELRTKFADRQLRVAQALAIVYFILALLFPRVRAEQFIGALWNSGAPGFGFMLFAAPLLVSLILGIGAGLITLNRRPDIAERQRLVAFSIASPFMASGLILPYALAPVLTSIGLLIFLVGGVQYHVIQGRRAQFMSRFLAPQVADLVREAIDLARQIREGGIGLCDKWSTADLQLGVGVGAATGFVTVGVIGAASRLEYTAVGPAVNLASRLCSEAMHGEVLVDERCKEMLATTDISAGLRTREPLSLKGFAQPVPNFVLDTA
jgi:class 3 adenylate cyclase